jgi:hypothetical protein
MAPQIHAFHELEQFLGRTVNLSDLEARPVFGGEMWPPTPPRETVTYFQKQRGATLSRNRTLTAVTLATHLERAGLRWQVVDPGVRELSWWRKRLMEARANPPVAVGICTTFLLCEQWFSALCAVVREVLPQTKLIIGGYYYALNAKKFLSFDADVFCIGEGEVRLPKIVKALRDKEDLSNIPGLYIRRPDGSLTFTGQVEPLDMNALPKVDWSLAKRIEPPVDFDVDELEYGVETQRGCVFKCEFCNYRTLQAPNVLSPEAAVDAIFNAGVSSKGFIRLTDATATFPHDRWQRVMQGVVDRGGAPRPMWAFARVSDLSEKAAELMGKAGLRWVFIGQESGDQRILNAMRKGTKVSQVKPAINALGKNGIRATMAFIHGFPGENAESLQNTRHMLETVNDGFESDPVALMYLVQPLAVPDFASVSQNEQMKGVEHFLGYESAPITPQKAMDEKLTTLMAISRVPHGPVYLLTPGTAPGLWETFFFFHPRRYEIYRWLKAVDRGVAVFLERDLEGKPPNMDELRRLRETILAPYPPQSRLRALAEAAAIRARAAFMGRAATEWTREKEHGPGLLTRSIIALSALRDTGKLDYAKRAWDETTYPKLGVERSANVHDVRDVRDAGPAPNAGELANELRTQTFIDIKRRSQTAKATDSPV